MRYFGGKVRISKPLAEFLNKELENYETFVDMFCGSCNIVSKIRSDRVRIANDKNRYLIAMRRSLQDGTFECPDNITEDEYLYVKNHKDENLPLTSFVGFGCSFAGKFFGGYARGDVKRNYCENAKNSILKKMKTLQDVRFYNVDYKIPSIVSSSLIYCDIPYKDTTQYNTGCVGTFDHGEFYKWCKRQTLNGNKVLVSEYK